MCTFSTCLLFSSTTNSLWLRSISLKISTRGHWIFMKVWCPSSSFLSISVWVNAFGLSHATTSLFYFASTIEDIIIDSVMNVGLETCSLSIHWCGGFQLKQCLTLIITTFFSVGKISDCSTCFLSVALIVFGSICMKLLSVMELSRLLHCWLFWSITKLGNALFETACNYMLGILDNCCIMNMQHDYS